MRCRRGHERRDSFLGPLGLIAELGNLCIPGCDWLACVCCFAQLPTGTRQALPYLLAVMPPLACAIAFPGEDVAVLCCAPGASLSPSCMRGVTPTPVFLADVFFSALDFAGTYGVLTLFGLM